MSLYILARVYMRMCVSLLKEHVVAMKKSEHINMLRAEACPVRFLLQKTDAPMAWMLSEYTARTLPALDSALHLFSTMTVDSPSWTGDALRNTSQPPTAQFGLTAARHPLHH